MTYTTDIKNTKYLDYGSYKFVEHDGQVLVGTEYNSRVTFTNEDGSIDRVRTVQSLLRFNLYQKTAGFRRYLNLTHMIKRYSIV